MQSLLHQIETHLRAFKKQEFLPQVGISTLIRFGTVKALNNVHYNNNFNNCSELLTPLHYNKM